MTVKSSLFATPFLAILVLLTWLLLRGINSDAAVFDQALQASAWFETVEGATRRDVLSARVGLLRDYDPLVQNSLDLDAALDLLRTAAKPYSDVSAATDRLGRAVKAQEDLVEQFKTNNAVLRNSLNSFGLLSVTLGASNQDPSLVPTLDSLGAAMLNFTLDSSTDVTQIVRDRLDALARATALSSDKTVQALLSHGRMVADFLPATDHVVRAIFAGPTFAEQTAVREAVLTHQLAARRAAVRYRLLLYGASVALVGMLVNLGMGLRTRARALQTRAGFEHLLAGISLQFINARTDEIPLRGGQALHALADFFGADRGYTVLDRDPPVVHRWQRQQTDWPHGWPEASLALSAGVAQIGQDIIQVDDVGSLPPSEAKSTLMEAGVRSWVSARRHKAGRVVGLLGLEWSDASMSRRIAESGLLLMALDAIANAADREWMERERARLEGRLQQARRMETVGAFAAGIAHNFNNILAAILGYVEMEETKALARTQETGNLRGIRAAGERGRDLVEQILTFGRRRDASRQCVDVPALIEEAVSLLRSSMPADITLVVSGDEVGATVSGEAGQLQQVILNLCNNAVQATTAPGQIMLDVQAMYNPQTTALSHGEIAPGHHVRIAVSDKGRGMSAATLGRVFEPFFTTRVNGHGLGLATVLEIVRDHHGVMHVTSTPGAGSRFEVWLPLLAAPPLLLHEGDARQIFGHGEMVMIVNEEQEGLLRDEETLAALGYQPIGLTSAAAALAACKDEPTRFDALLVSNVSPDSAAAALAADIHESVPSLAILLATRFTREIETDVLAKAGVLEMLQQPLLPSDLANALERALAADSQLGSGRPVMAGATSLRPRSADTST